MPRPMKISSEGTGSRSKKRLRRMQIRMTHPSSRRGPFKRITNLSEIYLDIGRSAVLPTRDACRHSAQQTLGPFSAARLFIVSFHYMRKHGAYQLYESKVFGRRAGSWLLCVQSKTGLPRKIRSRPVLYAVFSERASDAYASLLSRYKKATIWARVQGTSGLKLLPPVPEVMPSLTAHATASA